MSNIYLSQTACKARMRDAENARKNRGEIVKAYSQGQVSRRELFKWGLFTSAGLLAPIGGLSPFVQSVHADGGSSSGIPTGSVPSPLFGAQPFTQSLLRLEVLKPSPAICIDDPTGGPEMTVKCKSSDSRSNLIGSDGERQSCQDAIDIDAFLGGGKAPAKVARPEVPGRISTGADSN